MFDRLFDSTSRVLAKGLELRMLRQGFLAANVANAETPNYRPVDVDFRATMEKLVAEMHRADPPQASGEPLDLQRTDARHLTLGALEGVLAQQGSIVFAAGDDRAVGNDSNATGLEEQMGRLQMNSLQHSALTRILGRRIAGLRNIVDSAGRL